MLLRHVSFLFVFAVILIGNVHGASWSSWRRWSSCSCENRRRTRMRRCLHQTRAHDHCPGTSEQTRRCRKADVKRCDDEFLRVLKNDGGPPIKMITVDVPSLPNLKSKSRFSIGEMKVARIGVCADGHDRCSSFAHLCSKKESVKTLCKKTCGGCATQPECKESREQSYCRAIKRLGYCSSTRYRVYLTKSCGKTCQLCSGVPTTKPTASSAVWSSWKETSCSRTCGTGKRQRYRACVRIGRCLTETHTPECKCNGEAVKVVTCQEKACSVSSCKDELEGSCAGYKNRGYCKETYVEYMTKNCALTCGFCKGGADCGIPKARKQWSDPIVGGEQAKKGYWPWQVAIARQLKGRETWEMFCGGTLIDRKRVLSAAHCLIGSENYNYRVTLGEHNREQDEGQEQTIGVEWTYKHEDYDDNEDFHDIALIFLSQEAKFDTFVTPACLPSKGEELKVGKECFITGWGSNEVGADMSQFLFEVAVPVAKHRSCADRNKDFLSKVTRKMICVGFDDGFTFKSSCHGDSGGPLSCADQSTQTWKVNGVVSWGDATCNGLNKYSVFTKVSSYRNWIDSF